MRNIMKEMNDKRNVMEKWLQKARNFIKKAPEGFLKVDTGSSRIRFYHFMSGQEKKEEYISVKNTALIKALAQKEYCQKAARLLEKQIREIDRLLARCPETSIDEIYENMHPAKRMYVTPLRLTDAEFVRRWQEAEFETLGFKGDDTSAYYTDRGERVRSKSEVIIANFLNASRIPYRYECVLILNGRKIFPDFTILDIRTRKLKFLEHLGMMGDPEYSRKAARKIRDYEANDIFLGEQLLCTFETDEEPLDTRELRRLINHVFGEMAAG